MFVFASRCFVGLHHFDLVGAVLARGQGEVGCGAPGWEGRGDFVGGRQSGMGGVLGIGGGRSVLRLGNLIPPLLTPSRLIIRAALVVSARWIRT